MHGDPMRVCKHAEVRMAQATDARKHETVAPGMVHSRSTSSPAFPSHDISGNLVHVRIQSDVRVRTQQLPETTGLLTRQVREMPRS